MKFKLMFLLTSVALFAGAALHFSPGQAAQANPEVIDDGHYLYGNGSDIVYSTNGTEGAFCAALVGEVYGRVPYGGGKADREQLLTNCDAAPFPDNAMVSTSKETYFITGVAQAVDNALFVRPADGSGPANMLTNDQNVAPRALAIDESYVYYVVLSGTSSQIMRRNINTDAVEIVAPVGDMVDMINGLAVDETNVFWTEGFPGSNGRVRRAPKTGGVPVMVADGLDFPASIELDGNLVYWAEEGGHSIGRRLKAGIGITQTIYTTDRPVTALDIHNNIVFFGTGTTGTINGSLWRVSVDGQNPTLMAYGFAPPRGILWAGGWVYWVDSKLRRISPKAVSDPVDYKIEHIEITQGVQDGDHTMPLVAGKSTMVRVYAREVVGPSDDIVSARLYGYRNGIPLPGSPLSPVMFGKQDLDSDLPGRGDADQTHTFQLPAAWLMGDPFQLQAEINPGPQFFELDFNNNRYPQVPETFEPIFRLVCLTTYPVAAVADDGSTTIFSNDPAVYDPRMERAKLLLPTVVHVDKMDTVVYLVDEDGNNLPHNLVAPGGESALLDALVNNDDLSDPTPGCEPAYTRPGGLVDIDAENPPNFGGRANDSAFWARWWESDSDLPYVQPAGGFLWAHEFAHTLDRPHVDCGGAAGPGFYPYTDPCTNGDANDFDASWGYDLITGTALDPLTHRDLMAYGSQRWVSDYTWRCLSDFIGDQWGLPGMGTAGCDDPLADAGQNSLTGLGDAQTSAASPAAGPVLFVDGAFGHLSVNKNTPALFATATTTDALEGIDFPIKTILYPTHTTVNQQIRLAENPNTGPWQIAVLDSAGQTLSSKYIQPDGDIHDSENQTSTGFSVALPLPNDADRIEIRDTATGELLFEKVRGSSRPAIQRPRVEVNPDGDLEVSFSAQDADQEPLNIIAQYVEPGGRKQLLAYTPRWTGETFRCDPCVWPGRTLHGGEGTVRLLVSDGFDSIFIDLPIVIPTKGPEVSVHAVQVGPLNENGYATYRLSATIWDAEDRSPFALSPGLQGFLKTAEQPVIRYEWQVNGTKKFAINEPVILLSQEILALKDGEPTVLKVAVTATDSDGQSSTETLEVNLKPAAGGSHNLFLPMIQVGD